MTRGTKVTVTGSRTFNGTVLAAIPDTLIIEESPGRIVTLRRDCASTKPLQWQCAGMPVEVREQIDLNLFRAKLWDLERRTRQ